MNEQSGGEPVASSTSPIDKEERTWAMATHLSVLSGIFTGGVGAIVAPLVIWLLKKEDMPFVDEQGKEALNFQITMLIAGMISLVLMIILIGFLLLAAVVIFDMIMVIVAAIKANDGVHFRYPFALRLIK